MLIAYSMFSVCLIVAYLLVTLIYIVYWNNLTHWLLPKGYIPSTSISVLIAARNEASNIETCLEAIANQTYPTNLSQIYVIDDHSEDDTAALVRAYAERYEHIHLLSAPEGQTGKKNALAYGIEHSDGQLIVTTDADCIMGPQWLTFIAHFYEKNGLKFIAAPVAFHQEESLFEQFQSLDFMGMMAVASAGIEGRFMGLCNGANLAYERAVFNEVGGFTGIDHVASGDDMLLLQKIQALYPHEIGFLKQKEATTYTHAKPSLRDFVEQRIRWASKSGAYKGWQVWLMLGVVWVLCISMVIDLIFGVANWIFLFWFILKLVAKGISDYFFLRMMAFFFDRLDLMRSFVPASIMHWWYIVGIGTASTFRKRYHWKGRYVR